LTSVSVSSTAAAVANGQSRQFAAAAYDQFGARLPAAGVRWSLDPGSPGSVAATTGLFRAPASGSGLATIRAAAGPVSGTAQILFMAPFMARPAVFLGQEESHNSASADLSRFADVAAGSDKHQATAAAPVAPVGDAAWLGFLARPGDALQIGLPAPVWVARPERPSASAGSATFVPGTLVDKPKSAVALLSSAAIATSSQDESDANVGTDALFPDPFDVG
jgi:hypothetical protein